MTSVAPPRFLSSLELYLSLLLAKAQISKEIEELVVCADVILPSTRLTTSRAHGVGLIHCGSSAIDLGLQKIIKNKRWINQTGGADGPVTRLHTCVQHHVQLDACCSLLKERISRVVTTWSGLTLNSSFEHFDCNVHYARIIFFVQL